MKKETLIRFLIGFFILPAILIPAGIVMVAIAYSPKAAMILAILFTCIFMGICFASDEGEGF